MHGVISSAADVPVAEPLIPRRRPRFEGPAPVTTGPGSPRPAIEAQACARWARAEGLKEGDAVVLLVRDAGEVTVLRLGLALAGVRAEALDVTLRGEALAGRIAACGAVLAIVDTALADAYAGVMGRIESHPAVWWNGPDADFARLDRALAEYRTEHDAPPTGAAER